MGYPQVTMVVSLLSHGLVTWMIGGTLRGTSIILLRGGKKKHAQAERGWGTVLGRGWKIMIYIYIYNPWFSWGYVCEMAQAGLT